MATALLNPLINSISGRIGNAVFYCRGSRQCMRTYVVPRNPDTASQKEARRNFANAVKSWQSMNREEKYAFTRKARSLGMSGYNLFISIFVKGSMIRHSGYKALYNKKVLMNNDAYQYRDKHHCRIHSVSKPFILQELIREQYFITGKLPDD